VNGNHYVVQKYLNRPFLIEGLKFDFRIYVLLAGTEPLRVYLYNEGLVRLATHPYHEPNSANLKDMCMHLTNYAINKNSPEFVFNTSEKNMDVGHKRSLSAVF
jgi:tubulin polyglutamylase TTLL6/13